MPRRKGQSRSGWIVWPVRSPTMRQSRSSSPSSSSAPTELAVDSKGKVYAADQGVGAVFIFNPETKDVEMIRNGREAHFGVLDGLAMDDDDRLFVTDNKLHHVLVFNANHVQEAVFRSGRAGSPAGIALDRENRFLYVADTGNDVVDVFDADTFKLLRQIGKPSRKHDQTDPGTFSLPEGVAVDKEGNVYVTDTLNARVQIFDADGGFISTFGKNWRRCRGFASGPKGLPLTAMATSGSSMRPRTG